MDYKEQTEGEKRVRDQLISPLCGLGLGRPTTMTVAQFEEGLRKLEQMLAYMTDDSLAQLSEWVQAHPGGKGKDRWPIPLHVLAEAKRIQMPDGSASPLMRAVFAHDIGRGAIRDGWAPELLEHLRAKRSWPGAFAMSLMRQAAEEPVRRMTAIEGRLVRGEPVGRDDTQFRDRRLAVIRWCQGVSDEAAQGSEAAE